jgi:very-short-patch-repair endonuclease
MPQDGIVSGQKISQEKMARAKELRRDMTPAERRLWKRLKANQLDGWHFRRQQIIDGLIVDFYCHKAGLVVEVDGPIHKTQKVEDTERTQALNARNLRVLRFTNREVMNDIEVVLKVIASHLSTVSTDSPSRGKP